MSILNELILYSRFIWVTTHSDYYVNDIPAKHYLICFDKRKGIERVKGQTTQFRYNVDDIEANHFLETIDRNQRRRWKRRRTIPWQITRIFDSLSFDLGLDVEKRKGIHVRRYSELLWHFSNKCIDKNTREAALYLHENIIKFDL